jgi:hypothetical protein
MHPPKLISGYATGKIYPFNEEDEKLSRLI